MANRGECSTAASVGKSPVPPRATATATGSAGAGKAASAKAASVATGSAAAGKTASGKAASGKASSAGKEKPPGKSNSSENKDKVTSSAPAQISNFDARLTKMEELLSKVIEAMPSRNAQTDTAIDRGSDSCHASPTGAMAEDYASNASISSQYYHYQTGSTSRQMTNIQPTGQMEFIPLSGDMEEELEVEPEEEAQPENFVLPPIAAKFAMPLDIGNPIDDEVAQSATYLMTHQLEQKVLDEVTAKYPAPSNCDLIDTPKVNPPIWDHLPTGTKSRDLKLQRVQKSLTRGLNAYMSTLSAGNISETQQDTLALLCNANFELNCVRKELIKPDLNARFTHLCKPSLPASRLLFGDDLGKQVKDLKDQQQAAAGVMKGQGKFKSRYYSHPYKGRGFQPVSSTRYWDRRPTSGNQGGPFLGQRTNRRGKQPPPHTQTLSTQPQHVQAPNTNRGAPPRRK